MGQSVKQAGGEVAGTATDQVKKVAEDASRQARDLVNEAREQIREQARSGQRKAAGGLSAMAKQLEGMAEIADKLAEASITSTLVRQVSEQMHSVASWVEQREPEELVDEARNWARRHPGAFLVGAAVAGVIAGRVTRAGIAAQSSSGADASATEPIPPPTAVRKALPPDQPVADQAPSTPVMAPPPPSGGMRPPADIPSPAGPLPPSAQDTLRLDDQPSKPVAGYHPSGRVQP
ncbi:MAG: hypothetical protein M3143_08705 [Actinomycetota bacterium]|nr:hypothetical protein [Actinomycetota bacterium]